jgi:hypothetical protein
MSRRGSLACFFVYRNLILFSHKNQISLRLILRRMKRRFLNIFTKQYYRSNIFFGIKREPTSRENMIRAVQRPLHGGKGYLDYIRFACPKGPRGGCFAEGQMSGDAVKRHPRRLSKKKKGQRAMQREKSEKGGLEALFALNEQ